MPAAGTLDRRLTILRRLEMGTDSHGAPIFIWADVHDVWAAKIHQSEDEEVAAGARYARRVVTFRTRFLSDVFPSDRLRCENVEYGVLGVRELGRREGLEIAAETHNEAAE